MVGMIAATVGGRREEVVVLRAGIGKIGRRDAESGQGGRERASKKNNTRSNKTLGWTPAHRGVIDRGLRLNLEACRLVEVTEQLLEGGKRCEDPGVRLLHLHRGRLGVERGEFNTFAPKDIAENGGDSWESRADESREEVDERWKSCGAVDRHVVFLLNGRLFEDGRQAKSTLVQAMLDGECLGLDGAQKRQTASALPEFPVHQVLRISFDFTSSHSTASRLHASFHRHPTLAKVSLSQTSLVFPCRLSIRTPDTAQTHR